MKISFIVVSIFVLAQVALCIKLGDSHKQIQATFCWKDSYGRGIGTIPSHCRHRVKIGLLCYDHCPPNYSRFGFDCHQRCTPGFTNQGLYCRRKEHTRKSFPWKFGDWFNSNKMIRRCQRQFGWRNCQRCGLIVYPKCRRGYSDFLCFVCRPPVPNCRALGYAGQFDLSCKKRIKYGRVHSASCPPGKQYDAGLCYKRCDRGYFGVGPICWAYTPAGWVGCGLGAAVDSRTCAQIIFDKISSVAQLAVNVATLGSSGAISQAANAVKSASKLAKLKKQFQTLKNAVKGTKQFQKVAKVAKKAKKAKKAGKKIQSAYERSVEAEGVEDQLDNLDPSQVTSADIVRISAQIAALADPTGIASTVSAFSYPKCSHIFYNSGKVSKPSTPQLLQEKQSIVHRVNVAGVLSNPYSRSLKPSTRVAVRIKPAPPLPANPKIVPTSFANSNNKDNDEDEANQNDQK